MLETNKKTVVVLGGTRGLGLEIVLACSKKKWRVAEIGRSAKGTVATSVHMHRKCDLSDIKSVRALLDFLDPLYVDHFFWIAGVPNTNTPFSNLKIEEIDKIVNAGFHNAAIVAWFIWNKMVNSFKTENCTFNVIAPLPDIAAAQPALCASTTSARIELAHSLMREDTQGRNITVRLFLLDRMQSAPPPDVIPVHYSSYLKPKDVAERIMREIGNNGSSGVFHITDGLCLDEDFSI